MGTVEFKLAKESLPKMSKLLLHLVILAVSLHFSCYALPQSRRKVAFTLFFKGNIIERTKAQAQATKSFLRDLDNNPKATKYLNRVFDSSTCLKNMDDAIETIDTTANLVSYNRHKILKLVTISESIENEKDTIKLLRSSGDIFRILNDLLPEFKEEPIRQCRASPDDILDESIDLARILEEIANERDLDLDAHTIEDLRDASKILKITTSFLRKLNSQLSSFKKLCSKNKDYNVNVLNAIGEIMEDMAELFADLGSKEQAQIFRSRGDYVKKSVETFSDLYIVTDLECGTPGSLNLLADNLDDLAQIIEEVGIDKLSEELKLDLGLLSNF